MINNELEQYNKELAERPQIVALNKIDLLADQEQIVRVTEELNNMGYEVFPISAVSKKELRS